MEHQWLRDCFPWIDSALVTIRCWASGTMALNFPTMKKQPVIQLLEDYLLVTKTIATTKPTAMSHKIAVETLARIDKKLDDELNAICDSVSISEPKKHEPR